jgi:hypothetical protein
MENFFNWMTKPIPQDEVIIWFNIHNMTYEKIELYGDIAKSLTKIVMDTYLGESVFETKIMMSDEDKMAHFDWCWKTMVEDFRKENIIVKLNGDHKDYFQSFFKDTFYNQSKESIKHSIDKFLNEIFDTEVTFSKSDLDLLTELYKLMEKNMQ